MRTLPAGSAQSEGSVDIRTGSRPKLESANESAAPPEGPRVEPSQRVRSLPPFDPTVARPSRKPLPKTTSPTPKPILASDCLRDDAAPIEPHDRATRFWAIGLGAALLLCAAGMTARAWPLGSDPAAMRAVLVAIGTSVLVVALSLSLRRYAIRGSSLLVTAVVGTAALLSMQHDELLLLFRWLAPAPLAAALFLRVSYRSDRGVRALLGGSIVVFLAAACFVSGISIFAAGVSLVARVFAGAMALVAGFSLLGFMGEETTAGCTLWGTLVAFLGAGSLVIDSFVRPGAPSWPTLAFTAIASLLVAMGTFQIGATIVGPRLRVSNTSRTSLPAPPPPEPSDTDEAMLPSDD